MYQFCAISTADTRDGKLTTRGVYPWVVHRLSIVCPPFVHRLYPPIGEHEVTPATVVRNIGVIMDTHASMEAHVNNVSRTAYYHLYNIGRIRCYLSQSAAEQLVHAFITSKLDYCNALLQCATLWFTISTDTEAVAHSKRSSTHHHSHQQIGPHNASPVLATLATGMPANSI